MDTDTKPAQKRPTVSFRDLAMEQRELAPRAGDDSLGLIAQRDLGRYYEVLRRELASIDLTEGEALLIMEACNGTYWEPHTIPLLWAEVADHVQLENAHIRWQVDEMALVHKLRALTPAQAFAVVDAIERAWLHPSGDAVEALRAVGLLRDPKGE